MTSPLDKMRNVLVQMPPEHKKKLIKAYQDFSQLKAFCVTRGDIEILPKMSGIKVLKLTLHVRELKRVVDFLKPANFKWVDKSSKKADQREEV